MTHLAIAEKSAHEFIAQANKPAGRLAGFRASQVSRAECRAVTRTARLRIADRDDIIRLVSDFCSRADAERFARRVRKCSRN